MARTFNGFEPVVIHGEGQSEAVATSTFLDDDQLIAFRDNYIGAVRQFARKIGRERLDEARNLLPVVEGSATPRSIKHVMACLRERVSDGFTRDVDRNGDYTNVVSLDETFAGLGIRDIEGFLKGFEEALVRFYAYAELAAETERNIRGANILNRPKIGRFDDIATRVQNDIGSELLADGLAVLACMRDLGHKGDAEYDAADTPALFFSSENLEILFDTLSAMRDGEISLPADFPPMDELLGRILQDPEVAPNEIRALIRRGIMGDREPSDHPVYDETPIVGSVPKTPNSPMGHVGAGKTQTNPERHLVLVRD